MWQQQECVDMGATSISGPLTLPLRTCIEPLSGKIARFSASISVIDERISVERRRKTCEARAGNPSQCNSCTGRFGLASLPIFEPLVFTTIDTSTTGSTATDCHGRSNCIACTPGHLIFLKKPKKKITEKKKRK